MGGPILPNDSGFEEELLQGENSKVKVICSFLLLFYF